jgi:hypothetical protein
VGQAGEDILGRHLLDDYQWFRTKYRVLSLFWNVPVANWVTQNMIRIFGQYIWVDIDGQNFEYPPDLL